MSVLTLWFCYCYLKIRHVYASSSREELTTEQWSLNQVLLQNRATSSWASHLQNPRRRINQSSQIGSSQWETLADVWRRSRFSSRRLSGGVWVRMCFSMSGDYKPGTEDNCTSFSTALMVGVFRGGDRMCVTMTTPTLSRISRLEGVWMDESLTRQHVNVFP